MKRFKSPPLKSNYKDLAPSLAPHLTVVFVGFNPGVESSISQHHYAHFSNLFWKLFNQSRLALSVIPTAARDKFVTDGLKVGFAPYNDLDLARYGIGFTDLVLRCTKLASELSAAEKLSNVPRLLGELRLAQPRFVVFIGKGVWETVVRYLCGSAPASVLSEFTWGHQTRQPSLTRYDQVLKRLCTLLEYDFEVYVFPSTSGLVTTLNFAQKLELWEHLAKDIYKTRLLSEVTSGESPTHGCKNSEDAAESKLIQTD
jgi:G:T/U-mismatch repair DNA glycosylase